MSKIMKIVVITFLVVSLALSFGVGCIQNTSTPPVASQGLDAVEEAWDIIFQEYVDKNKLDDSALSQAAIRGIIEELDDPYTSYMTPQTYQMGMTGLKGKYEGIGAYVGVRDEQIVVIAPFDDSPAAEAGIRAGDIILGIDGSSTLGMSLTEAVLHIRGPEGTPVMLLVLHQDETEPEEIEIVRAEIKLHSVRFEMREDIAYISISQFTERTSDELSSALASVIWEGATGIIIDLRSNPGGLLEVVVDVASYFLREGIVVHVVDNQGEQTSFSVRPSDVITDLPLVVLTDNYSASGSEVLAGALQDHDRAAVGGTITYGKGSVNTLYHLGDGSGLYITTARWLTPDGRLIEGEGITPDYEFDLVGEDAIQWAIGYLRGDKDLAGNLK